jgi:hypothetical protein
LFGGKGRDRFVLQKGGVAIVEDFRVREDWLVLPRGVAFADLTITRQQQSHVISWAGQMLAKVSGGEALQANYFVNL